ncbi:MAG: hypothetical protein QOG77_1382 [Solirubrobacteraceae bacterium]|nr:hypothetical protein [Solirubrobacteraceae bacterium]
MDTLLQDLWGEDQPQSAVKMIHVAVSQLRKVLPEGTLQTRAPGYALQVDAGCTDLERFDRMRADGHLRDALALWRGPALAEFAEPFARREAARLEDLRLGCLADRIDDDLARGEQAALVAELEGIVTAHPLRERPRRQLMLALYRSGRQADALAAYRDFRAVLDEQLGIEPSQELRALELSMLRQDDAVASAAASAPAHETVRYVQSGDVSIAYQVVGDGPLDIVLVHGWVCSFHPGWERPAIARFYERLGEMGRLVLFDKRGTGLSDRVSGIAPLEERMDDLRAVLDAVGSEHAVVCGVSEGGAMSALYAATHPARVAGLVVIGGFARRTPTADYAVDVKQFAFTPVEWGLPAARRFVADRAPSLAEDEEAIRWYASYLVRGGSPGAALHIMQMNLEIDVRHVLPTIHVPTLVLYREQEYMREATRYMGDLMPRARTRALPGADHLPWEGDQEDVLAEIEAFVGGLEHDAEPERVLATVLHAQVPAGLRPVLRGHLRRHRGTELPAGASALRASFDGPARAIRCAHAIVEHGRALGHDVAAGLHTGECEVTGSALRGLALDLANGVSGAAASGEVLVSSTVRDLVAGSGMEFDERGLLTLPAGDWRLFAARAPTAGLPVS